MVVVVTEVNKSVWAGIIIIEVMIYSVPTPRSQ